MVQEWRSTDRDGFVGWADEAIEKRIYEILPQEASDWVRDNGIPQPADRDRRASAPGDFDPDSAIISLTLGSYIAGQIEFIGNRAMPLSPGRSAGAGAGPVVADWAGTWRGSRTACWNG